MTKCYLNLSHVAALAGSALHTKNVSDKLTKMSVGHFEITISCESTSCYMVASDCNYCGATFNLCIIQLSHKG